MATTVRPRWKIVSDGIRAHVYDEHGNEVPYVRAVSWKCGVNEPATATMELLCVAADLAVPALDAD